MSSYQAIHWTISFTLCAYCLWVTRFYCSHPPYTLHTRTHIDTRTHTAKTEITFYDRILMSLSDISVRRTGTLFFWCNDYVYPAAAEVHKGIIEMCARKIIGTVAHRFVEHALQVSNYIMNIMPKRGCQCRK